MCLNSLDGVSMYKLTLGAALTVSLQDIDIFNVVFGTENGLALDGFNRTNNQICKKDWICVDKFA